VRMYEFTCAHMSKVIFVGVGLWLAEILLICGCFLSHDGCVLMLDSVCVLNIMFKCLLFLYMASNPPEFLCL